MTTQRGHKTVISARDVSVGYRDKTVWEHVTFDIDSGEFVVVLGPNGAGKTTLFRLLLGLAKPMSGSLKMFGNKPERGNLQVGYLPQRRPLDSETKIAAIEYVRLGLAGHKWGFALDTVARQEYALAREALVQVDAESLANRPLSELSGGEAQRIYLAQALVGRPKLLLLDEPLANLDIRREVEFIRLVKDVVNKQNITVLLIAHDVNPLLTAVDRIMYVANGKIALGKLDEVVTSQSLSELYDAPIEVVKSSHGRLAVLGIEEAMHHDS
jgi:zinc/manganese transport system ATP-binding protein